VKKKGGEGKEAFPALQKGRAINCTEEKSRQASGNRPKLRQEGEGERKRKARKKKVSERPANLETRKKKKEFGP